MCVFLVVYSHWCFCFIISVVSQRPGQDFFKCLPPQMKKKGPISLNFPIAAPRGSHCWQEGPNRGRCVHQALRSLPDQPKHTTPVFGEQGPHCLSWPQPSAPGTWAAIYTPVMELRNGGWSLVCTFCFLVEDQQLIPSSSTPLVDIRVWSGPDFKIVGFHLPFHLIGCFGGGIDP